MMNRKIVTGLALVAFATLVTLAGCTTPTSRSGTAADTVTAIGSGTGSAAPDTAQFSLGVTFMAKDRVAAQDGASSKAAAIVAAVKASGIDAKDIQTGQISLNQQLGATGRTVTGYQASQSIDVKTKLIDKVGAVIAAATAAGATDVSGPSFALSDTNAARVDAIDKAVKDAKVRATAMANAAGRKLGRVISVKEAEPNQVAPFGVASASLGKAGVVPLVEPGAVDASTQLTVVFALE